MRWVRRRLSEVASLTISGNTVLTSIDALQGVTKASGGIAITTNAVLGEVTFDALATVGGVNARNSIDINGNPSLSRISFGQLTSAPYAVTISGNGEVVSELTLSFPKLASVTQNLTVRGNFNIPDMSGFAALKTLAESLELSGNQGLQSLAGLDTLTSISGQLLIRNNAELVTVALPKLSRVSGGIAIESGYVDYFRNINSVTPTALTTVDLPVLATLSGTGLAVGGHSALTTISCPQLALISGDLKIGEDDALTGSASLYFPTLSNVTGAVYIAGNDMLNSLGGFPALMGAMGGLYVNYNVVLPSCSVDALRAQVEASGSLANRYQNIGNLADSCVGP